MHNEKYSQELQRKLRHVNSNIKSLDLPTNFKFFFLKNDRHALEKAKGQIQKFLNVNTTSIIVVVKPNFKNFYFIFGTLVHTGRRSFKWQRSYL